MAMGHPHHGAFGCTPGLLPKFLQGPIDVMATPPVKLHKPDADRTLVRGPLPHDLSEIAGRLNEAYTILRERKDELGLECQRQLHELYCGTIDVAHNGKDASFLLWHRAFLYFHERLLGKVLDDPDFRIPYWAIDDLAEVPVLEIYESSKLPALRAPRCWGPANDPDSARTFLGCGLHRMDLLLATYNLKAWHDPVHGQIVGGGMSNTDTAAGDPIFYVFHSNVDRVYSSSRIAFEAPKENQNWVFFDAIEGEWVFVRNGDCLDAAKMGYRYHEMVDRGRFPCDSSRILVSLRLESLPKSNRGAFALATEDGRKIAGTGASIFHMSDHHSHANELVVNVPKDLVPELENGRILLMSDTGEKVPIQPNQLLLR